MRRRKKSAVSAALFLKESIRVAFRVSEESVHWFFFEKPSRVAIVIDA
jgi:hypothetical protein